MGHEVNLVIHSVCDVSPVARQALAAHGPATAAKHIFKDVMNFVFPEDRKHLESITEGKIAEWRRLHRQKP
eukprot:1948350-Lingulodinium_polyedra.AAC.1